MKRLEKDIVRATESEIVLSKHRAFEWGFRFLGLMLGIVALMPICFGYSEYLGEFLVGYCPFLCLWIPFVIAVGQSVDRTTTIQFNQPVGYLTVKESPWWSILIPAGPRFIKVSTQIPLSKRTPLVEDQSGPMTYHVRSGPDTMEVRQSYIQRFQVQLPLVGGKVYPLWTTSDRNTYIEIIRRINKAIQDCNQMGD